MVVLHVLAPAPVGGLERVVDGLIHGLLGRGHEVHVAALLRDVSASPPLLERMRSLRVSVHPVLCAGRRYLDELRQLRQVVSQTQPSVVHSHGYHADVLTALAARKWKPPIVTTVHGFTGGDWKNWIYERLQRWAFRSFDAVVPVSSALLDDLRATGVSPARLEPIRNAYVAGDDFLSREEARDALGLSREGWHVGWIGRLSAEKGPDVFVDAVDRLGSFPVTASLIGTGAAYDALTRQVARHHLEKMVRLHGLVSDAARYLKAFDVFVLSSRTEGIPIVLLEAMAAGIPIVATRVGGVPEVVGEDQAVLVPSEDPERLAGAIRRVVEDAESAAARAANAQVELASTFEAGAWISRYESVYVRLVAAGSR